MQPKISLRDQPGRVAGTFLKMNTIKITYLKNQTRHVSTFRGATRAEAVAHVEKGPDAVWIEEVKES